MKLIRTKFLRLIGKKYITTPWVIYASPKAIILDNDLRHEEIHQRQQRELLFFGFILWYGIEWFLRFAIHLIQHLKGEKFSYHKIYRSISLEKEAYYHDADLFYTDSRQPYSFLFYL